LELVDASACLGEALIRAGGTPPYGGDEAARDDARCVGNVLAFPMEDILC